MARIGLEGAKEGSTEDQELGHRWLIGERVNLPVEQGQHGIEQVHAPCAQTERCAARCCPATASDLGLPRFA